MKVSELIEKLRDRRNEYFAQDRMNNVNAIQDVMGKLYDHLVITGDHEMGADWRLDDV